MENIKKSFAENLKTKMEHKRVSAKELAEILGVKESTIWAYRTGRILPGVTVLIKMRYYFNTQIDQLLGLKGNGKEFVSNGVVLSKKQVDKIISCLTD